MLLSLNSIEPETESTADVPFYNILSLDGGAMRGLIPAYFV
jgi:hypothetical protein